MIIKTIMSTRIDHDEIHSAEDILKILSAEGARDLSLQFMEGRGALKSWIIAGPVMKGSLHVYHHFSLFDDDGGKDYHRDPVRFLMLFKEIEKKAPEFMVPNWRKKSLWSLKRAIGKIKRSNCFLMRKRFKSFFIKKYELHHAEKAWLRMGQSLPKGLIGKYKAACR